MEETEKCKCGKVVDGSTHTCPYAMEINDSDVECNCCDDCIRDCCMDI